MIAKEHGKGCLLELLKAGGAVVDACLLELLKAEADARLLSDHEPE